MGLSSLATNDSLLPQSNVSNTINNNLSGVPGTPQVLWQTAFWSLVGLAVLTMSQPCGRVCGLPSRYRTYLRSSPFICAADTLVITIRLVVASIYFRISPIRALRLLQQERFKDVDEAEGLQSLGSSTIGRWIFAVLGPLPVMIKLASFTGTPWTQACGTSFMVSFIVTELVILSAPDEHEIQNTNRVMLPTGTRDRWRGQQQHNRGPTATAIATSEIWFSKCEQGLLSVTVVCHFSLLLSITILPLQPRVTFSPFGSFLDDHGFALGSLICFALGSLMCFLMFIVVCVVYCISIMIVDPIQNLCTKHITVGKWLALVFPESEDSTRLVVDKNSIRLLLFFLENTLTAALAYWLRFDSAGTINPRWTTIFG